MQDAIERAHMGHPDFRVNGRIFATLHPDHKWGIVKLTPDQQQELVPKNPATFAPENGAWGRQGCTAVRLASVDEATLGLRLCVAGGAISCAGQAGHQSSARISKRRSGAGHWGPASGGALPGG